MLLRLEATERAIWNGQALARTRADRVEALIAAVNQIAALLDDH